MPLIASSPKPRVILGLMTFGPRAETNARITDLETFREALDILQRRGYNELDTARVYTGREQEGFTREAGWREKGFKLATKVVYPADGGENTREGVRESVETSLKELGTDCVDLLYLHRPDRATPFDETLAEMDKLHKEGKFVELGLSNFSAYEVAEVVMLCRQNGWVRPTTYQAMYNAITRSIDAELIPACRRYGLDIVVYNPIAGGLFSGKIRSKDMVPEGGRFGAGNAAQGEAYRKRYFRDSTFEALRVVEEAADKAGLSMIETALRWTVHHSGLNVGGTGKGGNDGLIIGVSSTKQLEENLDHLEKGPLPEPVVAAMEEAWRLSRGDTAAYWHGELAYGYDTHKALFGK